MTIVINVDRYRRIRVYKEGGLDLEAYVNGIGWVLHNDADIPDHVINSHVIKAREVLNKVKMTQ